MESNHDHPSNCPMIPPPTNRRDKEGRNFEINPFHDDAVVQDDADVAAACWLEPPVDVVSVLAMPPPWKAGGMWSKIFIKRLAPNFLAASISASTRADPMVAIAIPRNATPPNPKIQVNSLLARLVGHMSPYPVFFREWPSPTAE